jgi:hypothetical protein
MESTLEMAVQDRIATQKQLSECDSELQATKRELAELKLAHMKSLEIQIQ